MNLMWVIEVMRGLTVLLVLLQVLVWPGQVLLRL
jgi:hypothetical protein